jgi:integrase
MATLERISPTSFFISERNGELNYEELKRPISAKLSQIFWADGSAWREANLWAFDRGGSGEIDNKTIDSNIGNLTNYANFLESQSIFWFSFPTRKADRCLVRYRGWLIGERDQGRLSPGTASEYMRTAIAFYRWILSRGLLEMDAPLWRDSPVYIRYFDAHGFERMLFRVSADLAIPNRKRHGIRLEGGLLPLSNEDRDSILDFSMGNAPPEIHLMLSLGFFTGMRIGSISDLKIETLHNAVPDPMAKGLFRISLGPGASPAVHTKYGVTGSILIPQALLESLLIYVQSIRRSRRQILALREDRDLVFLTRHGNPYCRRASERTTAINTAMADLRLAGKKAGIKSLSNFRFHQSRCTFATEVATIAIQSGDPVNAIGLVRELLLHSTEATSYGYIKFATQTPMKVALANEFMRAFSGLEK